MSKTINTIPPVSHGEKPIRIGAFLALFFAMIFFSGIMAGQTWFGFTGWGVFDFTTLNGAFGKVTSSVTLDHDNVLQTTQTTYRGINGRGAMEGFMFALGLVPAVMFALAMINVLEHYGALHAARKLLTPILRPLLGIPGNCALAMIGSLQSTDVGASLTRKLSDENQLTENQRDTFIMFQFSAGSMITNFFGSGAVLFTFMLADGTTPAMPVSIGLCIMVMFIMKIVGANILRFILTLTDKPSSASSQKENH